MADPDRQHGELEYRRYGSVTVLVPAEGAAYPNGGTVVVAGADATLLIDPSLAVRADSADPDVLMISHAHEDHLSGVRHFDVPVHGHHLDIAAIRSPEVLLDGFGYPPDRREEFARTVLPPFGLIERPDAIAVPSGHRFDLGGGVSATVVHLPGHTAGHCGVLVEPDGFFFIADIDLTGFGPYYGDVGSSLAGFIASIEAVADVEARWYGTFHQKGVVEGHDVVRERLAAYRGVIDSRRQRLLDLLAEPATLAQIAEHRLVFRPHVDAPHVETVERRTARLHLDALLADGQVVESEPGLFRAVPG